MTFDQQAKACGVAVAKSIGIAICDKSGCDCSGIFVQLTDGDGQLFAVAPLTPENAMTFAALVRSEAAKKLGGVQ